MKKQTGVWIDAQVWENYKALCNRERLRPAEPIERFLRFVLHGGSAVSVLKSLSMAGEMEGFEAYARVLLKWYTSGTQWIHITDEDEAPVVPMLLETLKHVANPELRHQIEEALTKETNDNEAHGEAETSDAIEKKMAELKKLRSLSQDKV